MPCVVRVGILEASGYGGKCRRRFIRALFTNMPYEYIADALCGRRQFYEYRQEFIKRVASAMDMLPEQKGQEKNESNINNR